MVEYLLPKQVVASSNLVTRSINRKGTTCFPFEIGRLVSRYHLWAQSQGYSQNSIEHTSGAVSRFADCLSGIPDARRITVDEYRYFVASLRNKLTWANCPDRKKKPLSPTTINTYARGVRAFWGWLKAEQIIDPNPLAAVKAPKLPRRIPKVYTEDQLRMVLKTVERRPREIAIIETFLDSGMRLSELTGLSIKDVNLKTGTIKVFGKGSKERFVYISPMTSLKIEEYLTTRSSIVDEDPVFATIDGRPLSLNRVQVILQEVGKKAGIGERLAPHKLRHTYATMSLRNGSNLEYLRIAMGHTDIKTTSDCYLAMSNQDIALAHRRFSPMANLKIPKRSGNG